MAQASIGLVPSLELSACGVPSGCMGRDVEPSESTSSCVGAPFAPLGGCMRRDVETSESTSSCDEHPPAPWMMRWTVVAVVTTVLGFMLLVIGIWNGIASASSVDNDPDEEPGETGHFDSHNHIGGVLGWRGFIIAYLMAAEDNHFKSLLRDIGGCGINPTAYGRLANATTDDICLYEWIRTTYLRTNGCQSTKCPAAHLAAVHYIAAVARTLIKEKFSASAFTKGDYQRQQWSSHTLNPLLQCIHDSSEPTLRSEELHHMDRMIESVLSASPQIDFDSSYIGRESFMLPELMRYLSNSGKRTLPINADCPRPPFDCKQGKMLLNVWVYTLHALVFLKVRHVQWSHPHFSLPFADCEKEFEGLPDFQFMVHLCRTYEPLHWLVYEKRIEAVQNITIKYNPMFVSKVFAEFSTNGTYNILSGQTRSLGDAFRSLPEYDGGVGLLGHAVVNHTLRFLDNPNINGIDFASQEYNMYNLIDESGAWSLGGGFLKMTLDTVSKKARQHNKSMFFHIHCGEGFPTFDYEGIGFRRDAWENPCVGTEMESNGVDNKATCDWISGLNFDLEDDKFRSLCSNMGLPYSEQKPIAIKRCQRGVPLHYKNGRDNMINMLNGISKYRAELKETGMLDAFDARVVVVFGHSTHADARVARGMVVNRVWADICLTSNLATNAIADIQPLFEQMGVSTPVRFLESLMSTDDVNIPRLIQKAFVPHGFKSMFNAGVCMTLSTDGSGVEHSHFDQEYKLAEIILRKDESRKLQRNAHNIMEFLAGRSQGLAC